jgi:hypothetical protein
LNIIVDVHTPVTPTTRHSIPWVNMAISFENSWPWIHSDLDYTRNERSLLSLTVWFRILTCLDVIYVKGSLIPNTMKI